MPFARTSIIRNTSVFPDFAGCINLLSTQAGGRVLSWREAGLRRAGVQAAEGGGLRPVCPQPGSAPGCPDFSPRLPPTTCSSPAPTLPARARRALGPVSSLEWVFAREASHPEMPSRACRVAGGLAGPLLGSRGGRVGARWCPVSWRPSAHRRLSWVRLDRPRPWLEFPWCLWKGVDSAFFISPVHSSKE